LPGLRLAPGCLTRRCSAWRWRSAAGSRDGGLPEFPSSGPAGAPAPPPGPRAARSAPAGPGSSPPGLRPTPPARRSGPRRHRIERRRLPCIDFRGTPARLLHAHQDFFQPVKSGQVRDLNSYTVHALDNVINGEFDVIEKEDKAERLFAEQAFGYKSVHYLIGLSRRRATLPEYRDCSELCAELQIRTALDHAWAEVDHRTRAAHSFDLAQRSWPSRALLPLQPDVLAQSPDRQFPSSQL
jgi:hypothetical protein